MSFENYVHHIAQKHRLAVALAILKDLPEDKSVEKYIEEIRSNINNDNDVDSDVCSADFNLDDDVIIVNNNDLAKNNKESTKQDSLTKSKNSVDTEISNNILENTKESISILNDYVFHDSRTSNNTVNKDITNPQVSQSLLKEFPNNEINISKNIPVNKDLQSKVTQCNVENTICANSLMKTTKNQQYSDKTYYDSQMFNDAQNNYTNLDDILYNHNITQNNDSINDNYDSQATLYSVHDTTQYNTHVSQSQHDNIVINEKLFKPKCALAQTDVNENINKQKDLTIPKTILTNEYSKQNNNSAVNPLIDKPQSVIETDKQIICDNSNTMEIDTQDTYNQYGSFLPFSKNDLLTYIEINTAKAHNDIVFDDIQHTAGKNEHAKDKNEHITETNEYITVINEHNSVTNVPIEVMNENTTEINEHIEPVNEQMELVPFKVIEELNKVKSYLRRTVERRTSNEGSMDSGYRSDSQTRSSYKSSRSSSTWLNQSAHCLFDYIATSPIKLTIQEITSEIAQVLAELIDILHEEEKYLAFLDEILEYVETLIQDIFTGGNCEENVLLKKDELIHRLLLTNISTHIQIYTIEKLINILEDIQPKLTNAEQTYEISNIDECENLCHIFHTLEVILRRYMKRKPIFLHNTNSQELNRTSITDIWRRKWNPNFKNADSDNILPKKCILVKCNEVLNKYVVNCMEAYSLVSYAALQCFNLLQN